MEVFGILMLGAIAWFVMRVLSSSPPTAFGGSTSSSPSAPPPVVAKKSTPLAPPRKLNGPDVYKRCKALGMDVFEIQRIEAKAKSIKAVRAAYMLREVAGLGKLTQSEAFAECMFAEHVRLQRERIVTIILIWSEKHSFKQFAAFNTVARRVGEPDFRLPDEVLEQVWSTRIIDMSNDYSHRSKVVTYIPDAVFDLPNLEVLKCGTVLGDGNYNVHLKKLPASIGQVKSLREVHFQRCGIEELPSELFTPWIEKIKLGNNQLTSIPAAVGNAKSLTMLTAWGNPIEHVSSRIGDLPNLKRLDLCMADDNLVLPDAIAKLGLMDEVNMDTPMTMSATVREWFEINGLRTEWSPPSPLVQSEPDLEEGWLKNDDWTDVLAKAT